MYNIQANGLSQALLRGSNPKFCLLAFEPLMIKKSDLKQLEVNQLISLGNKLPKLFVYHKGVVVGQAALGSVGNQTSVVISAKERISNLGKPEPRYTSIEARVAVLPKGDFVVGRLVRIPANSIKNILLFSKETVVAKATLAECNDEIFLQIQERY
ncbi:MAG: hypothetical protein HF962_07230 [Sulfurovum sp.]|nr:hypothetical protein [Sulfurovum sp.]